MKVFGFHQEINVIFGSIIKIMKFAKSSKMVFKMREGNISGRF
jgi:hypothetical protein